MPVYARVRVICIVTLPNPVLSIKEISLCKYPSYDNFFIFRSRLRETLHRILSRSASVGREHPTLASRLDGYLGGISDRKVYS